ncbi:hypothetical protein CPB86DRAFT_875209 [Serendipita vermifera]|nr:hypothetical protein CPB86DRAFT_875209 [Serendipita vermifera]
MSNSVVGQKQSTPMIVQPEPPPDRQRENNDAYVDDDSHGSDRDAPADEDIDMIETEQNAAAAASTHGSEMEEAGAGEEVNSSKPTSPTSSAKRLERKPPSTEKVSAATLQARARLRTRSNLKRKEQTPEDLESEEDDGMERNLDFSDSEPEGEDELDSDADLSKTSPRKTRLSAAASKKVIKNVKDLPVYAQHAYVASTFGLPKLPVPMVLLPGLRSRKPPPIPVPDLTKRSRGRHVSSADDDAGRKYHCNVPGCDKRFARGEHLKRHIRSIHTHEKPHQCPYPGCLRGFSRTDNMMQHMRTHDDWPDDETAAKMIAESEKKTHKKVSAMAAMTAALGPGTSEKEFVPIAPMIPPMPWQMHPLFFNWAAQQQQPQVHAQQRAVPNFSMQPTPNQIQQTQVLPKEGQPGGSPSNGATVENGADLSSVNEFIEGMSSPEVTSSQEQPTSPPSGEQEQPATIAPGMMMISTDEPKITRSKSSASKSKTNPNPSSDNTTSDDAPATDGTSPTQAQAQAHVHAQMAQAQAHAQMAQMNAMMAAGASLVPGMGWPMAPPMQPSQAGLQFPFMSLVPPTGGSPLQMPGGVAGLPPGLPFPPPAIAVPIPAGAPLPHPAQLPPNAQLVPDGRGGHTIIIPPPPGPWNLPFPGPGMMPGPLPTHANGGFPIPIPIPTPTPTASPQRTNAETTSTNDKTTEVSSAS